MTLISSLGYRLSSPIYIIYSIRDIGLLAACDSYHWGLRHYTYKQNYAYYYITLEKHTTICKFCESGASDFLSAHILYMVITHDLRFNIMFINFRFVYIVSCPAEFENVTAIWGGTRRSWPSPENGQRQAYVHSEWSGSAQFLAASQWVRRDRHILPGYWTEWCHCAFTSCRTTVSGAKVQITSRSSCCCCTGGTGRFVQEHGQTESAQQKSTACSVCSGKWDR